MLQFLHRLRCTNSCFALQTAYTTGNVWTLFNRFSQVRGIHDQLALADAQRRTIYALSSAPGKAGVAVVRISGPDALFVWNRMVKSYQNKQVTPKPWRLERCHIVHPGKQAELLDDGLAVFFRGEVLCRPCLNEINMLSSSPKIIY